MQAVASRNLPQMGSGHFDRVGAAGIYTSTMHSGESFFGLLTSMLTACVSILSAGEGMSRACRSSFELAGSSQGF